MALPSSADWRHLSHAALLNALVEHPGYCSCAYGTALPFVRDFFRLVVDRTDRVKNTERFWRASEGLVELLQDDGSPVMRSWFVYALDKADLIMHGFNLYDVLIMDRWRWLLDGLERFPGPPPGENAEAELGAKALAYDRSLLSGAERRRLHKHFP
jgi:hypothetical protein